ncbi:MAG: hypothetical protein WAQ27_04220 [Candidatus Microsaccharimonas sp.]
MSFEDNPFMQPSEKTKGAINAALEQNLVLTDDEIRQKGLLYALKNGLIDNDDQSRKAFDGLASIETDYIRDRFEIAFQWHREVFGQVGLQPPEPEDFTTNGEPLYKRFGDIYRNMDDNGLVPELVMAPYGMSPETWESIFDALKHDESNPGNQLQGAKPFEMTGPIRRNWHIFDRVPIYPDISGVELPVVDDGNLKWTLRIIPGKAEASELGQREPSRESDVNETTIAEYLTAQALRVQSGRRVFDQLSVTTLAGFVRGIQSDGTTGDIKPYGAWWTAGGGTLLLQDYFSIKGPSSDEMHGNRIARA